ncbi:DNA polymerase III subunit beta [candidate division WOR-3 bacterium JGI_Cruoil_03_51_56]|uniref:Beta sliding clamp n=1 Tax=candidate division WOR-3 bacterium JGI_Cruoil_03_51_56 TaxID=1973747 RepID=A0A235BWY3_UNCW3|nr:MAG: DNA polymerase III subunit beta [candidate division WOR-3 bacterium JGI_Cruoil_03_51_56]
MRCEIDRGILADMLAVVVNTLPSRTTYPVLQNVMLEVAGGKLAVSGTDLDSYVRKEFALTGKFEEGKAVLPGRKLMEMVRELGEANVLFFSKDSNVHVEAGNSKAVFAGLDPAEFPEMPKLPEGTPLEFPIATITELFDAVSFAVSRDESRPAMGGVDWEVSKSAMKMVATDGHRLSFVRRKGKFPATFKLIVSPKALALLPREQDVVKVYSDPGKIGLVTQDTMVIGRPIEGPYPDYERVIPQKDYPFKAIVKHDAFVAVLRRAAIFAHPVGKLVALDFKKDKVIIQAETPEIGSSEEELICEYNGEPVRIGFNAGYLLEIFRHLNSEKVVIELQNPLSAGLLKPLEKKPEYDETFLLMPIRLD